MANAIRTGVFENPNHNVHSRKNARRINRNVRADRKIDIVAIAHRGSEMAGNDHRKIDRQQRLRLSRSKSRFGLCRTLQRSRM